MSIEDVRVLVAERQRYDDWLAALAARRAETPLRVFERVFGDYSARRAEVMDRLHTHVDGLATLSTELDQRLSTLETALASLEDERVEAMLRTAVGEFDENRWEEVRTQVEARIVQMGQERNGLLTEVDEVRTLLSSARVDANPVVGVPVVPVAPEAVAEDVAEAVAEDVAPVTATPVTAVSAMNEFVSVSLVSDLAPFATAAPVVAPQDDEPEDVTAIFEVRDGLPSRSLPESEINLVTELPPRPLPHSLGAPPVEFDDALALFSDGAPPADPGFVKSLDGIEVEIDVPVGKPRGAAQPDVVTATATPPSNTSDPFDDLAFLRSVIDPGGTSAPPTPSPQIPNQASGPRASTGGEAQKTLRCTECGTMNLPTEWYCERCGGELAAF